MGGTLLFVHGTGTRAEKYTDVLERIAREVERHAIPLEVRGCYWGDVAGARLAAEGASIPGYDGSGGGAASDEEATELALWDLLYTDPWYELRVLSLQPATTGRLGEEPPAERLARAIDQFAPTPDLTQAFEEAGLELEPALAALRRAPELQQAAQTATADGDEHRRAVARGVVAYALTAADTAVPDRALRDALVARLTDDLHGHGLGPGNFVKRTVFGLASRGGTSWVSGRRGRYSDSATPFAGDVLRFLVAGDTARDFLRSAITSAPGPVHLLGHSLGGIMCVDLLVREALGVASLVTVGSQAPFLYEIGALPALTHPEPLPAHFPRWLNVYDRRDFLAYLAAPLFDADVADVEVDNGQPFVESHSAYWANEQTWKAIREFVA